MKISIITVCYNSAKTIEKTIQSVLNQTYTDIEYIVVDGDSKDNTPSIIKQYETKINKLISEPDRSLYDAMNKGIAVATGSIIGILNSDDVFCSNEILEQIARFHAEHKIEASVGNIIQVNKKGGVVRMYSAKNWRPEKLKIGFMPPHPAIFFQKKLFDLYECYRLDFRIASDYELITRFFLKHKISWKYSGITTTAMLIGGISNRGYGSYVLSSKEIKKSLIINHIPFNHLKISLRWVWKIADLKIAGLLKR